MRKLRRILILALVLVLVLQQGGLATIYYAQLTAGDIDAATQWDDAAGGGGGGTDLVWANIANGDVLVANGKTIYIHSGVNVGAAGVVVTLSTVTNGGTAGGGFIIAGTSTMYANLQAGTTLCLTGSGATFTATLIGNYTGGSVNGADAIATTGTETWNITGNGAGGSIAGAYAMRIAAGTVTVVSSGAIAAGGYAHAVVCSGSGSSFAHAGNVTGGTAYNCIGLYVFAGTVSVTSGDVTGGTNYASPAISNVGAGTLTLTNCNLIYSATTAPTVGRLVYNPGATNYIRYPTTTGTQDYYYDTPTAANTLTTDTTAGVTGTYHAPEVGEVIWNATVGTTTGTYRNPTDAQVLYQVANGVSGAGTVSLPNTGAGSATGNAALVLSTGYFGAANATAGTYWAVPKNRVKIGYYFGANRATRGSYGGGTR